VDRFAGQFLAQGRRLLWFNRMLAGVLVVTATVAVLADTSRRLRVPYLASDTRRPQRPTDGVELGP
jgi:hypothetical protein